MINEEAVRNRLTEAIQELYETQSDIYEFTSETAQTEWNLAAHLAPLVAKRFGGGCPMMSIS